jgi:outer membrane usher protein FimD/PapC
VVDGNGYAVVPYLQPYQLNTVELDPKDSSTSVELKSTKESVAPRAGTVTLLNYETTSGRALLVETTLPDGRPIPFGANVLDEKGDSIGVAGQASRLYVRDMQSSGVITVQWGEGDADSCQINVQLQASCVPKASAATQQINSSVTRPVAVINHGGHGVRLDGATEYAPLQRNHISHGLTARDAV